MEIFLTVVDPVYFNCLSGGKCQTHLHVLDLWDLDFTLTTLVLDL